MTSIQPLPAARTAAPAGRAAASAGKRFAIGDPPPAGGGVLVRPAERTDMLTGLLSLQDMPEGVDQRGHRRARALLAGLAALQLRLLRHDDASSAAGLEDLRGLLRDMPRPDDAGLAHALDAVALRVEVELARHGEA